MFRRFLPCILLVLVSACGSSGGVSHSPTVTATTSTVRPTAERSTPQPKATPTVVVTKLYAEFLAALCNAFATGDSRTIVDELPYYQYNNGLRYGWLGDGEGQTGDPSLMASWLVTSHVRCHYFTPGEGGHGTLLTSGWSLPAGPWSLVEVDQFEGRWKINDFTFGKQQPLWQTMQINQPILRYGS
jgi:hypothetical protein